jgi:hypothetical protein
MSALPLKADIDERDHHVRFVPKGDITRLQAEFPAVLLDTPAMSPHERH